MIDELGKQLRQAFGSLLRREVRISRDFVEAPLAEDLAHRIRRDRHVLTTSNPGLGVVSEAGPLHLLEQTAQATAGPRRCPATEHLPEDAAEAAATGLRPAPPACEHREHHRQERHHDVGPAAAGCGRALGGTPTPLLTKAPTQRTAEQIVEKSHDLVPPRGSAPNLRHALGSLASRVRGGPFPAYALDAGLEHTASGDRDKGAPGASCR